MEKIYGENEFKKEFDLDSSTTTILYNSDCTRVYKIQSKLDK